MEFSNQTTAAAFTSEAQQTCALKSNRSQRQVLFLTSTTATKTRAQARYSHVSIQI